MKHIKKFLPFFILSMLLIGCGNSQTENQTIVENIILNQSTYKEVKEVLPNMDFEMFYNTSTGIMELTDTQSTEYTINNVTGKLSLYFDNNNDKLLYVRFDPSDYSKDSGELLKTWLFNKYTDYEQTTIDTGFIFSNGFENVELYITDNPIDTTKYHGLYIEWSVVE